MRQCRPPGSLPAPCGRGASAVVGCRRAACRLIPGVQLVAGGWQPAPCRRLATKRQAPRRRLPGQCRRRSKMVRARGHAWTRGRRCRAGLGARAPTGPTHASCPYRFCARTRRLQGARRLAALIGRNWCGPFLLQLTPIQPQPEPPKLTFERQGQSSGQVRRPTAPPCRWRLRLAASKEAPDWPRST